jgi:hypothetical protein
VRTARAARALYEWGERRTCILFCVAASRDEVVARRI